MLVACDKKGNLVNLLEEENVAGDFFCPLCQSPVRLKRGQILRPHFAHISLKNCQFAAENESREHLGLKADLYRWLEPAHSVRVEAFLPDLDQIADLLVGKNLALEVQCSSLSLKRLKERTDSYRKSGYQVLWLLGQHLWLDKSLSALQKNFLYFSQNMGFHLWELDEGKKLLRLKYLIHEDLHGQAQYKTREFPFEQGDLLETFRLPYQAQYLTSFLAKEDRDICRYVRQQLYYQQPKWMAWQAACYAEGKNLLTYTKEDFYPQVKPVQGEDFCQISQDLSDYYRDFEAYYQKSASKNLEIVYPPAFYRRVIADL